MAESPAVHEQARLVKIAGAVGGAVLLAAVVVNLAGGNDPDLPTFPGRLRTPPALPTGIPTSFPLPTDPQGALPSDFPTDLDLPTNFPTDVPTDFDLPDLPELPGGAP